MAVLGSWDERNFKKISFEVFVDDDFYRTSVAGIKYHSIIKSIDDLSLDNFWQKIFDLKTYAVNKAEYSLERSTIYL